MSAYHYIVILMILFIVGIGYASTYDIVEEIYVEHSYQNEHYPYTGQTADYLFNVWTYLTIIVVFSLMLYAYVHTQKEYR